MTFVKTDLTGYGKAASGVYTGNNSVNRAIPHGLGVTPKLVLIEYATDGRYSKIIEPGEIIWNNNTSWITLAVTPFDSTNFYVGNASNYIRSANDNATTWRWVAFG